jgi:gliding motility-associated-like protein
MFKELATYRFVLTFLFGMFGVLLHAQLVTNTAQTPGGLVQNVLLGPGVTVSNIQYSGSPQAIGYFNGANTNVGIGEGIVMTTGTVLNNGDGPHGPNNSSNSGFDNNTPGYFKLNNLLGGGAQTYNASILEFDFIPYSDTVRFSYVFGSEEYMEYVGSAFNDVFAFFISGPGIPGGSQNIARLTNGTPVAINNVNNGINNTGPCMNCAQYTYNGTGVNAPYNSSPTYIQYDGFTKVLEAVSKVQCGQTYHLIIAIADVGDGIFDSGIFLQANSLTSKVPVSVEYEMSFDAFNDPSMMAEGCVSTTVTLTRGTNNLSQAYTVPITVSGTAIPGVDFTNTIPSSVTFQPGQSVLEFTFSALEDGIIEGIETVILTFEVPDPCGGNNNLQLELKINDVQPVTVALEDFESICGDEPFELIPTVSGGVGPYTYGWSTGETTSSIFVTPSATSTYSVNVSDNCLGQTQSASATITIPILDPIVVTTSDDLTEICPFLPKEITSSAIGGAGQYVFEWTANGQVVSDSANFQAIPSQTTTYLLTVTDQCDNVGTDQVIYTITSPPLIVTMTPTSRICPGDSVLITASATGGFGDYFYEWSHSNETSNQVWVKPVVTTVFTVSVSDECQTFSIPGSTTVEIIKPIADFIVSSSLTFEGLPITFQNLTTGGVSYEWEFGDGNTSTMTHPNNTYEDPGNYYVTLIATNELGCKDTVVKPISVDEEYWIYVPNTFTPDGNRFNNYFSASTINIKKLEVQVFNRWGQLIFESKDVNFEWDGTYKNEPIQDGTYVWKMEYVTNSGIEGKLVGHITLLH